MPEKLLIGNGQCPSESGGFHIAWALHQGYEEVVDECGNVIGEGEDQLFARTFIDNDRRPSTLIARGPAGELYLHEDPMTP